MTYSLVWLGKCMGQSTPFLAMPLCPYNDSLTTISTSGCREIRAVTAIFSPLYGKHSTILRGVAREGVAREDAVCPTRELVVGTSRLCNRIRIHRKKAMYDDRNTRTVFGFVRRRPSHLHFIRQMRNSTTRKSTLYI